MQSQQQLRDTLETQRLLQEQITSMQQVRKRARVGCLTHTPMLSRIAHTPPPFPVPFPSLSQGEASFEPPHMETVKRDKKSMVLARVHQARTLKQGVGSKAPLAAAAVAARFAADSTRPLCGSDDGVLSEAERGDLEAVLPLGWAVRVDEKGDVCFRHESSGVVTWVDPRTNRDARAAGRD